MRSAHTHLVRQLDAGFTVLSYNAGNGLADPDRLAEYLGDEQADIAGIQELSLKQAGAIERRLASVYPHRLLVSTGFSGKGLLSKLPCREGAGVAFAPDRPDLSASVEVLGQCVRVIVAHPRPPKVGLTGVVFDPVNGSQILKVAEMAISERPAVILGDFNMTERQAHHGHRGSRVDNLPLTPLIRNDYVWYSVDLIASRVWVGGDAGSDHLPVLARLNWREGANGAKGNRQ